MHWAGTVLPICCILVCVCDAKYLHFNDDSELNTDPDTYRNATQLITSKGFPVENHFVSTQDGFILNVVRIPHGRNKSMSSDSSNRPVVYLQHGFTGAGTNFLTNVVDQSLAYLLADAGADVWVGNSRGNIYSMRHTKFTPKQREFWDFSWDEMASLDLPAVIDHMVEETGQDKIFYVGHSQGTAIAFAEFSQNQKVAEHIKHFIALAPVTRVTHMKSPIKKLAPFAKEIDLFLKLFGHGQLAVEPEMLRFLQGTLCEKWGKEACSNLMFLLCGFDKESFNMSRVGVYTAHNPAGTSVKDLLHWAQLVNAGQFQKFDFGTAGNVKHYNQPTPPMYHPRNIKIPVSIFRGGEDWFVDEQDYRWLRSQLTTVHSEVLIDNYEHLDFIWAKDVRQRVNGKVVDIVFGK